MSLAIEAFIENVRRFCEWAESDQHDIQTARQLLLALMQGVPCLATSDTGASDYPRQCLEDWKATCSRFSDLPFRYYRQVFSPCELSAEAPVTADLCDDLADIYGDLWHGLQALNRGNGVYALTYWRESYLEHWGHHASGALYAIDEYYRMRLSRRPITTA